MTRILSSRRFGLFLVLLGLSGLCLDDSRAQAGGASLKTQKLRVSEPRVAEELISGGAELIADYGSFQVLRVDQAQAAVAQAKPEVESITRHNIIELNTGPLDTTTPAVQALR